MIIGNPWLSDDVDTSLVRCNGAGCSYDWCNDMPRSVVATFIIHTFRHNVSRYRISIPQFMVGFALGTAGYPFCLTLSASIFSKVVGGSSDPVRTE